METIGERINQIIIYYFSEKRGNKASFAKKMNENPNTVSNWVSRGNSIGKDVINKIIEKFPEVNSAWLLNGEGEMIKTNYNNQQINSSGNKAGGYIANLILNDPSVQKIINKEGIEITRDVLMNQVTQQLIEEFQKEISHLREEIDTLKKEKELLTSELIKAKDALIDCLKNK